MTTQVITSTTPVYHTTTGAEVTVVYTGDFNGARIRVGQELGTSPETYQLLPKKNGGVVSEPCAVSYRVGTGVKLKFFAQDVGSPVPSIRLTTND